MKVFILCCLICSTFAELAEQKTCHEPPDPGTCKALIISWYFDPLSGHCKQFIYGGCFGNGNRYNSLKECMDNCQRLSDLSVLNEECGENRHYDSCGTVCPLTCVNPPKDCVLMCQPGCHCDDGYVKTRDGHCVRPENCPVEINHVCGENERYYDCGTACPLTCDNYKNPPKDCPAMCVKGCQCEEGFVKIPDGRCIRQSQCPQGDPFGKKTCVGEPDPGECLAYMPSWYYDATTHTCLKFIYGGCQGNENRYESEEECVKNCGGVEAKSDICGLPAEAGICHGYFTRYHYSKDTGKCEKFIYGGCGGNENNFESEQQCQQACA